MAVSIARRTLLHEWRRFLPSIVAVAFSCVLIVSQGALLLGIVSANALYVTQSDADLWVGFRGTQSVELGRTIATDMVMDLYAEPGITRIEPFLLGSGDWRGAGGGVSVTVVGIDTSPEGLGLARIVPSRLLNALNEPGTILVDAGDSGKLSIKAGETAEINGQTVRVIGLIDGLRGLGGVNVVGSLTTARALDRSLPSDDGATYFLSKVAGPDVEPGILRRLNAHPLSPDVEVWRAADLADMSTNYMLLESGAGVAFVFAALVALAIGSLITSQTLLAAVAGSIPQYATLRALGVPFHSLRGIVVEQAVWIAFCGLLLSCAVSLSVAGIAHLYRVPFDLRPTVVLGASLMSLVVSMIACMFAMRRLRAADPAMLLRQ